MSAAASTQAHARPVVALAHARVFRNEGVFDFAHAPLEMPGREAEISTLLAHGRAFINAGAAPGVLVIGPVGSGKTAAARFVAQALRREAKEGPRRRGLEVVVINARSHPDSLACLIRLTQALDRAFPDRGFSHGELLEATRRMLTRRESDVLVLLDEAQSLPAKELTRLGQCFTRFAEETQEGGPRLACWFISQTDAREALDESVVSSFGRSRTVHFAAYTREDLIEVVRARAAEALVPGVAHEDSLGAVADLAEARHDVRYAMELLHTACTRVVLRAGAHVTPKDVLLASRGILVDAPAKTKKGTGAAIIAQTLEGTGGPTAEPVVPETMESTPPRVEGSRARRARGAPRAPRVPARPRGQHPVVVANTLTAAWTCACGWITYWRPGAARHRNTCPRGPQAPALPRRTPK